MDFVCSLSNQWGTQGLQLSGPDEQSSELRQSQGRIPCQVADIEAAAAEADSAEALNFADWAVENAQLAMLDAIHARAYADKLAKAAANS